MGAPTAFDQLSPRRPAASSTGPSPSAIGEHPRGEARQSFSIASTDHTQTGKSSQHFEHSISTNHATWGSPDSGCTVQSRNLPDFVSSGLINLEQAESYFACFFRGCDHYVPVFDTGYDTLHSIRQRSGLLFAAICTVGCRVVCGTESHQWRLLDFHLKRVLSNTLSYPHAPSLETIQALLVRACYSTERSILVASATRLAIDMQLSRSYDELSTCMLSNDMSPHTAMLMRRLRTWLHLLVLSHILHVDAGELLTFNFDGDPRRLRILLNSPHATVLDRFLFAQVELNILRANIFASLSDTSQRSEADILRLVRDSKIDIELWHDDWGRIIRQMRSAPGWIIVNLQVQKCWADTMALCRAVKAVGVDNVDFMTPAQRSILSMAKESLRLHLQTIVAEPRSYLHNLRYAMDFVWAKCAFCYLLLLKLCILLPEEIGTLNDDLIACGDILSKELSEAGGGMMNGISNNTAKIYLQLLRTGTKKFTRALGGEYGPLDSGTGENSDQDTAEEGLDSFVPDQFVFEWDFPGLTLFSSSTTGIGWLDDILLGALNGADFAGLLAPVGDNTD